MTNQTNCNHRTPPKYNVTYLDDTMVIVNGVSYSRTQRTPIVIREDENTIVVSGVKYKKIEEQKPITLECIIVDCMVGHNSVVQVELLENILDRVEVEFLSQKVVMSEPSVDVVEYHRGWDNCLKELKARLRE